MNIRTAVSPSFKLLALFLVSVPDEHPVTVDKIRLVGRRLFNDRRLSRDQSLSCASCHDPKRGSLASFGP